jgi:hypothetical protein
VAITNALKLALREPITMAGLSIVYPVLLNVRSVALHPTALNVRVVIPTIRFFAIALVLWSRPIQLILTALFATLQTV